MSQQEQKALPQVLGCSHVWPEHWGLQRRQLRELLDRLRGDPDWHSSNNVYTLVDNFIIPWTRGTGIGYALLVNSGEPKEVNVMVSHAWGENCEEFLEAVLRATAEEDVVYICALANYQAEDGEGPTIIEQIGSDPMESPFRRILNHIHSGGQKAGWTWRWRSSLLRLPFLLLLLAMALVCTPVVVCMVRHGVWKYDPGFEPERVRLVDLWFLVSLGLVATAAILNGWLRACGDIYPGRMLVVPNFEVDIYSRLWCVYEIFAASCLGLPIELAPILAPAGKASTRDALCRSEADMQRIRAEIEKQYGSGGFDMVDKAVRRVVRMLKWHIFGIWMKYLFLFAGPAIVGPKQDLTLAILYVVAFSIMVTVLGCVTVRNFGLLRPDGALFALGLAAVAGNVWRCGDMRPLHMTGIACFDPVGFGVVFLGANCRPFPPFFSPRSRLFMIGAMMIAPLVSILGLRHFQGATCTSAEAIDVIIYLSNVAFPTYMFWTEGLHWGVRMTAPSCPNLTGAIAWATLLIWTIFFLRIHLWLMLLLAGE